MVLSPPLRVVVVSGVLRWRHEGRNVSRAGTYRAVMRRPKGAEQDADARTPSAPVHPVETGSLELELSLEALGNGTCGVPARSQADQVS